jgi:GT2 family glycosyltransferase
MNAEPRTSIIVLNWNGLRWLDGCLAALRRQRGSFEVIVVDNASTDGSAQWLQDVPDIAVAALDRNAGYAGGNNAGARQARARDYLVFLNNDTVAQDGWLEALVGALDADEHAALATSHIVFMHDASIVDSAGDGYLRAGGAFKRWHGTRHPPGAGVEEVFGACGAAFAIRRRVFESLGGFDERLFMVYEDVDLSYRARLAGHRCVYVPEAVVHHAGSAALGRGSHQAVFYGQRNLEWVWLKNTPGALLWRTAPAHVAYSIAGCVYWAVRGAGWACLRGKLAALAEAGYVLRQRHRERSSRTADAEIERWLVRRWWQVKRDEKRPAPQAALGSRGGQS